MFEKLYSRELMLDNGGCAILAFQTECRLALSVRLPIGFFSSKQNVDLYLFILLFFLEMVVYAVVSSCFLASVGCSSVLQIGHMFPSLGGGKCCFAVGLS